MQCGAASPRTIRKIDEQDGILGHQPQEHHEADHGEEVERRIGEQQREQHADERKRQRSHDGHRLHEARELRSEHEIDENDGETQRGDERGRVDDLPHVVAHVA